MSADVFVLGAGFSRAVSTKMPVLSGLPQLLREHRRWNKGWTDLLKRVNGNVEHLMTLLAQPQPWSSEAENLERRAHFLRFTEQLAEVMRERQDLAVSGRKKCPEWFGALVERWVETQATVITFNYDTLVEKVYTTRRPELPKDDDRNQRSSQDLYATPLTTLPSRAGYAVLGFGNKAPAFTLLKLHGSVNWLYSGSPNSAGEVLYYTEPAFGWQPEDNLYQATQDAPDKVPLIVPPTTDKSTFMSHESVRAQWSRAAFEMDNAVNVYFIGYSMPETDLMVRFMVQNKVVHPQTTTWVVNKAVTTRGKSLVDDVTRSYRSLRLEGGVDCKYVQPHDVLPRFVDDYMNGDAG